MIHDFKFWIELCGWWRDHTLLSLSVSQQPPLVKNPSAMTATSSLIYYKYIALSFCGCYGFEVQLWHSTRQRGQRTTAGLTIRAFHSGVSSNCHIRTTAELNRYDGFQILHRLSILLCVLRCLQISWALWTESPGLNNWPQWNNKHAVLTSSPHLTNVKSRWHTACGAKKKKKMYSEERQE